MKKLFIFLILTFCINNVQAEVVKFNGKPYNLLYSTKVEEHNGYLNEYFKQGETYDLWSEMIAVHHFPNVYSPVDQAEAFRSYLDTIHCPSSLTIDEENNTGMIDFILINGNQLPIILEFNIFKYEKSNKCGTVAVQYAKRYQVRNTMQVEEVKKEFEKTRNKSLKRISKFKIPEIVEKDIDIK